MQKAAVVMDGGQGDTVDYGVFGRLVVELLPLRRRTQFFRWSRHELQSFLPHEAMLCATGDLLHGNYRLERVGGPPVLDSADAQHEDWGSLLGALFSAWRQDGYDPLIIGSSARDGQGQQRSQLAGELARIGPRACAAHGLLDHEHGVGAFFVFLGGPDQPQRQRGRRIELLVPHLCAALQRIAHAERNAALELIDSLSLSAREAEILRWIRAGKTNQQIGHILNISPYTVKNHVQNILRKMNATNRAQAASIAADPLLATQPGDLGDLLKAEGQT